MSVRHSIVHCLRFFIALAMLQAPLACTTPTPTQSMQQAASASTPVASASSLPLDHLAKGELKASANLAFGFKIPSSMTIERSFPNEVHLTGETTAEALLRYMQANAVTSPPELRGSTIHLSRVLYRDSDSRRSFRVEITQRGRTSKLRITDVTSQAEVGSKPLSDEEQWRRAGFKPNGEPLDVQQLR